MPEYHVKISGFDEKVRVPCKHNQECDDIMVM